MAGKGTVDRGDRRSCRSPPVDRLVLNREARAGGLAPRAARSPRPDSARDARVPRSAGDDDARDRGGARAQPGYGTALARAARAAGHQSARRSARCLRGRRRDDGGRLPAPRRWAVHTTARRRVAVHAVPDRARRAATSEDQGDPRYRGGRVVSHLRLLALPRSAALPPRGPCVEVVRLRSRRASLSLARARDEARKCVLLCSNCHAEVETGHATVPS